ncbi:Transposase [Roseomonas mucosa]|uniref:Transposase n=1 Tax=Roseomonas mucosa TaxID=207340 RepID=A0A4Y1MTT1_9PROT|nr:transposase [Roseomonas mucosa]AWV21435.1 Transposase [Roseomonas mucosa]MDT8275994.1 transposase [Roseomonas mucosa]MDT8355204.1 transposase [Roseomonas mucosa]MDU7520175.1 transposase [Roseomonas mucosa]
MRVKAYGQSELLRDKTDKLDAASIARSCRAHDPSAWVPPATHLRELRELVRRCEGLKVARVQEINRQKSGTASPAVAASIAAHLDRLDREIEAVMDAVQEVVASDPVLIRNNDLLLSIPGIGTVTAPVLLAEVPNIDRFPRRALQPLPLCPLRSTAPAGQYAAQAASAGWDRSLRRALYMCALSSRRRNPALAGFVQRMRAAGKPPKVILLVIARKLLVFAHAIVRSQKPFALKAENHDGHLIRHLIRGSAGLRWTADLASAASRFRKALNEQTRSALGQT